MEKQKENRHTHKKEMYKQTDRKNRKKNRHTEENGDGKRSAVNKTKTEMLL